jgi:hypothetical protein
MFRNVIRRYASGLRERWFETSFYPLRVEPNPASFDERRRGLILPTAEQGGFGYGELVGPTADS